jgi:hypothetical protein
MSDLLRVEVDGGKYAVVQDSAGRVFALRNGEPWRECVGDNLILALAQEVDRLRAESTTSDNAELALLRAEYETQLYVPGMWVCPKCGFVAMNSILHVRSGGISADLKQQEPCPNDGEKMKRQSWQEHARSISEVCEGQIKRAVEAEEHRDALAATRPYDCYWSRRALDAEEKLKRLREKFYSVSGRNSPI